MTFWEVFTITWYALASLLILSLGVSIVSLIFSIIFTSPLERRLAKRVKR